MSFANLGTGGYTGGGGTGGSTGGTSGTLRAKDASACPGCGERAPTTQEHKILGHVYGQTDAQTHGQDFKDKMAACGFPQS